MKNISEFSWRPLLFHMPCLVRLFLVSFFTGTTNSAISSRTLWTIFWLAKTCNKPISLIFSRLDEALLNASSIVGITRSSADS